MHVLIHNMSMFILSRCICVHLDPKSQVIVHKANVHTVIYIFPRIVCKHMHSLLSFLHYNIHIDSVSEGLTQEQMLIQEPDDQEQEGQLREENPQQTSECATEETNLSEEGRQDHILPSSYNLNY